MLHVGWLENYETTRGGGRLFFLAGGGTACLSPIQPCNFSHIENAPSARRKDLQERIAGMHGITAKPSLSRHRAALQLVASGYGQGGWVGCEGVSGKGGCSVRKVAQVARATNERRQDGKLEL